MRFIKKHTKRYPTFLCTDHRITLAKLNRDGTAFEYIVEKQLPSNVIVSDEVVDEKALIAIISQMLAHVKSIETEFVIGVSEIKATTRSLVLPAMKPAEISQAIERESESFLPFPYKDEYLDWMVIRTEEDGSEKILLSAIPRTIIDHYTRVFGALHLKPVAFETTSLSLFRLLPEQAKQSSLAMEVGEKTTVLILGYEGTIEASSVIQEQNGVGDKIEQLISYYTDKKTKGTVPDTLYICGRNVSAQLVAQIKEQLHLKIKYLQASILAHNPQQNIYGAVIYSLALKEVEPPDDINTINVLPKQLADTYILEQESRRLRRMQYAHIALVVLIIGIMGFYYFSMHTKLLSLQEELSSIENTDTLVISPETANLIVSTSLKNNQMQKAMTALLTSPPSGITVTNLFVGTEKGMVTYIGGTAHSRDHLLAFKRQLESFDVFETVTIPLSSLEKEVNIVFRIVLTVKNP